MQYQYNKIINLRIAAAELDGIVKDSDAMHYGRQREKSDVGSVTLLAKLVKRSVCSSTVTYPPDE